MIHHRKLHKSLLSRWLLMTLAVIVMTACTPTARTNQNFLANELGLEDCQLSAPGISLRLDAHCGRLSVPENPNQPQGRMISLHIAIIPAVSRSPAPDPIFFIPGGPGEAATESYLGISGAFEMLNQKRDIILVDQRGTGGSNPLNCDFSEDKSEPSEDISVYLKKCLEALDADPRQYTTSIAMDDLDLVRQALGYDQINIYGASYGTRAALTYLRQHPEHVRTLVLDGAVPPDWTLGPSIAADAQNALNALFDLCASDQICMTAFPNLEREFQSLLSELDRHPSKVVMDDPVSSETTTVLVTRDSFANTIHLLSYTSETAALIPLLIHTASADNDFRRFAAIASSYESLLSWSLSSGMRFSVICSEDAPYFNQSPISVGYLGDFVLKSFQDICAIWPRGQVPVDFRQPVHSDIPVLFISGELDPVTTSANALMAMRNLPNSLHLIAPGMGHINLFRGCMPRLATRFVESGTLQGLDAMCVQQIQPSPFFINFNGPTP